MAEKWAVWRAVKGRDLGAKICEIFKIDPDTVQRIDLHLAADEVAHATIARVIRQDEEAEIVKVIEEYGLVVRDDG